MRPTDVDGSFKVFYVSYEVARVSDPSANTVNLVMPVSRDLRYRFPSIWHKLQPLKPFTNTSNARIVAHIMNDLRRWIHPDSLSPVKMGINLRLLEEHSLDLTASSQTSALQLDAIRLSLDYINIMGQLNAKISEVTGLSHLHWVPVSDWKSEYPEPDFSVLNDDSASSWRFIEAFLSIMKHPSPYEGGVECMHQRTIKTAVSLLFDAAHVHWLSDADCIFPRWTVAVPNFPLLVVGGGSDLSQAKRLEMAASVRPTLLHLISIYGDRTDEPLPMHCFVYGLYWSRTYLSVFIHFPMYTAGGGAEGSGTLEVCQALVAQHQISFHDFPTLSYETRVQGSYSTMDDTILDRWRLSVCLFAVRTHMRLLEETTSFKKGANDPPLDIEIDTDTRLLGEYRLTTSRHEQRASQPPRVRLPPSLQRMRKHWGHGVLAVPREWIVADDHVLKTTIAPSSKYKSPAINELYHFSLLYLHPINKYLIPIDEQDILQNHHSDDYDGPDFLHQVHSPHFSVADSSLRRVDVEVNTDPHLYKVYGALSMTAATWDDLNIVLATVLADFSEYRVQWRPIIQYPFECETKITTDTCVVDFALAVQSIPATVPVTIARARDLPLTASSPAVLLGVRTTRMNEDGSVVTADEIIELAALMAPHLQIHTLRVAQRMPEYYVRNAEDAEPPTLFCTYLKRGFVHILAFPCGGIADNDSCADPYILDSLPISLRPQGREELLARMRVAMTLFTLRRYIVRCLCDSWRHVLWPVNVLDDEHASIVEVTGVRTPTAYSSSDFGCFVFEELGDSDSGAECNQEAVEVDENLERWMENLGKEIGAWLATFPESGFEMMLEDIEFISEDSV